MSFRAAGRWIVLPFNSAMQAILLCRHEWYLDRARELQKYSDTNLNYSQTLLNWEIGQMALCLHILYNASTFLHFLHFHSCLNIS